LLDYLRKCWIHKRECALYSYLGQEEIMTRNKAKCFIHCGRSGFDLVHQLDMTVLIYILLYLDLQIAENNIRGLEL